MKKNYLHALINISFLCIPSAYAHQTRNLEIFENDPFSELFNEKLSDFETFDAQVSDCPSIEETLSIILSGDFNVAEILKHNFFIRTNPIMIRNIIDSPILGIHRVYGCKGVLSIDAFYEHTETCFFTRHSPFIDSIIDLENTALINAIVANASFFNLDSAQLKDQIFKLLSIFNETKLQQRQLGLMFAATGNTDSWHASWRTPFYWIEHNFFITPEEQNSIEFILGPSSSSEQEALELEALITKIIVADRLGFGDTRLVFENHCREGAHTDLYAGIACTLPTAFTIMRGLVGGKFNRGFDRPTVNIQRLIDLATCLEDLEQAQADVLNFGLGGLCQLSSNICDRGLGNGGHFGIAPTFDFFYHVSDTFDLELYGAFEYLLPKHESRYFINKKNIKELDNISKNFASFDEKEGEAALNFLNQTTVNTFYPFVIETSVRPGFLLKIRPSLRFCRNNFETWIGYDFWYQSEEKLGKLYTPCNFQEDLLLCRGHKNSAQQQRLYFDMRYYMVSAYEADWDITFKGDWTISNKGIGSSLTAALGLQGTF